MTSKLVAEFVGTFLLIFTVGCAVLTGNADFAGFAIGTVLFIVILGLGKISGANFNPAVSVTLGMTKSMGGDGLEWDVVGKYCAVQIAGGIAATLLYSVMLGSSVAVAPAKDFSILTAGACELFYTFMLCFVVLNVAVAKKSEKEKGQYFGLAIGFCVVAGAYGAGAVSGGCFNPAVALTLDISSYKQGFGNSLLYVVFELIGAAMAAVAFKLVRPEDFGGEKSDLQQLVSEFLGTYMLVLTVGLSVLASASAAALSIAASLAAMIFALGDVSGAHFNPAVTCAIFASGRNKELTISKACHYVVVQVLAGVAAGITYASIYGWKNIGGLAPAGSHSLIQALVAEYVFTFLLSFTVLCVAVSDLTKSSQYFGLAIGFCVVVGGFAIGNISGGSLNPAVSFGLASVGGGLPNAAVYSAVELLAGATAAGVLKLTHDVELESEEAKKLSSV